MNSKQVALLIGYLDPEDRIALGQLKRGFRFVTLFSFKLPRLNLGLSLSLECLTKGGLKWTPLLDRLKTNGMKWTPLMNHKEA